MATSAIGAGDLTKLRGGQQVTALDVYAVKRETVATATITALPDLVPYTQVTVGSTSGWSDIEVGMLVVITNGSTIRGYATVRKTPTSTILYTSQIYTGAPGFPLLIRSAVQVSDTVTIYKSMPMWCQYSSVSGTTFYRFWDQAYTDQNVSPPPVANMGPHQAAKIAVGGSASFTLPKDGSDPFYSIAGANVTTYLWEVPTGVTITSGTSASPSIGVSATYGQHLVKLTVTDENGKQTESFRYLFVDDGTNYTALTVDASLVGATASRTRQGQEMSLTFEGGGFDLLPGTMILVVESASYDNGALTDGVLVDSFVGYISELTPSHDGNTPQLTMQVQGPFLYAENVVQIAQYIKSVTSTPARWEEVANSLSGPQFALFSAIYWHSPNLIKLHDFDADNNDYATPLISVHDYDGSSLADAMRQAAKYIAGNVGTAADGTIVLRSNPMYRDNTTRGNFATLFTIDPQDIRRERVEWQRKLTSTMREVRGGAVGFDGEYLKAWYARGRWEQGSGFEELPGFAVTVAEGIDTVKEIVGHMLAEKNAPYTEIRVPFRANMDVIDPVYMNWVRYDLDAAYDPLGDGFDSIRTLPRRVEIEYTRGEGGLQKRVTLITQPESFGQPAEQYFPDVSTIETVPDIIDYDPGLDSLPVSMAVVNTTGESALTKQAQSTNPNWFETSDLFTGTVCDSCIDWNSNFYTGGYVDGEIGAYVASISGTTAYLYYVTDIYAETLEVTEVTTITMADTTATTNARVEVYQFNPDYVAFAIKDDTGVKVRRSEDGGGTWSATTLVGSTWADSTDNENALFGMVWTGDVSNVGVLLIAGHDGSTGYGVYKATGYNGSFSAVTNTPRYIAPPSSIIVDGAGDILVSFQVLSSNLYNVQFGGAGYTTYTISTNWGSFVTATEETTGGNPTDHAKWENTSGPVTDSDGFVSVGALPSGGYVRWVRCDAKWTPLSGTPVGTASVTITGLNGGSQTIYTDTLANAPTAWTSYKKTTRKGIAVSSANFVIEFGNAESGGSGNIGRLDNLKLYIEDEPGAIYKCTDPQGLSGTPSWADISPFTGAYGSFPHCIAVDPFNTDNIDVLVTSDDSNDAEVTQWYRSEDGGSSWAVVSADTAYRFIERRGDFVMLAGKDAIATTTDGATTVDSRYGNLGTTLASTDVIKRIAHP